jgi:phosphoribosylaminoimidazole-succinocarboxamide synthase
MAASVSEILSDLERSIADEKLWGRHSWHGPSATDVSTWQAQGYSVYEGKVRVMLSRDGRVRMLHTDRLTAFDRMIADVPLKGVILTAISRFWLTALKDIVPNHYLESSGSRTLITEALIPIKAEVVVRGYLAGSLLRAYESGARTFCGVTLPDRLKAYQKLPEPIITPTTKAAAFEHDENATAEDLISRGVCSRDEWETLSAMALKIFSFGSRVLAGRGWLLADTKYEFGRSLDGSVKLIDEVHTPDSSRFWDAKDYDLRLSEGLAPRMLDKENIRRWLLDQGFSGYGEVPRVPRPLLLTLAKTYLGVAEALLGAPLRLEDSW